MQAIQIIRVKLDSFAHVEGTEWENRLQSYRPVFYAELFDWRPSEGSMLIRSLPKSLSFMFTVLSPQADMTIEGLHAVFRAEIRTAFKRWRSQLLSQTLRNMETAKAIDVTNFLERKRTSSRKESLESMNVHAGRRLLMKSRRTRTANVIIEEHWLRMKRQ